MRYFFRSVEHLSADKKEHKQNLAVSGKTFLDFFRLNFVIFIWGVA